MANYGDPLFLPFCERKMSEDQGKRIEKLLSQCAKHVGEHRCEDSEVCPAELKKKIIDWLSGRRNSKRTLLADLMPLWPADLRPELFAKVGTRCLREDDGQFLWGVTQNPHDAWDCLNTPLAIELSLYRRRSEIDDVYVNPEIAYNPPLGIDLIPPLSDADIRQDERDLRRNKKIELRRIVDAAPDSNKWNKRKKREAISRSLHTDPDLSEFRNTTKYWLSGWVLRLPAFGHLNYAKFIARDAAILFSILPIICDKVYPTVGGVPKWRSLSDAGDLDGVPALEVGDPLFVISHDRTKTVLELLSGGMACTRICHAIRFLHKAYHSQDSDVYLVLASASLEALIQITHNISSRMSEAISLLFPPPERKKVKKWVKALYAARSGIVHSRKDNESGMLGDQRAVLTRVGDIIYRRCKLSEKFHEYCDSALEVLLESYLLCDTDTGAKLRQYCDEKQDPPGMVWSHQRSQL